MAVKYYFEFTSNTVKPDNTFDIINHKVEIINDNYTDEPILIYGSCSLTKASTKDTLEPIRGGGLKIDLEVTVNLNFTDLYSEEERTFYVRYYQNNVLHSLYWLDPEGLYQSYVQDKWVISLDCTDGLGFLNNLSYVDNVTKNRFTGKQSQLEVIVNCLKRTGFAQNIYTSCSIFHDGMSLTDNVFAETYVNTFRYVKDDNTTTMQCNEVLRSVLELYNAVITQRDGGWYIYKPNELFDDSELSFFVYDSDGIALNPTKINVDFNVNIGSQIDNYYPFHVNSNQQITIDNSIGAYRINYKYGLTNSFYDNLELENVNGVIDEWTIVDATKLTFSTDNMGFILESRNFASSDVLILESESVSLLEGNQIIHLGNLINIGADGVTKTSSQFRGRVTLVGTSQTYYLKSNGVWSTDSSNYLTFQLTFNQVFSYEIQSNPLPIDGNVKMQLYQPRESSGGSTPTVYHQVNEFTIVTIDELGDLKGEIHTFQRIANPSSKIANNTEVLNGDSESSLYSGTIYQGDKITPTTEWNRLNIRKVALIRLMGEDKMKMYGKPLQVFRGSLMGYVDYLSVININNITGKFTPIEWSYDCKNNITTIKNKEILNNDLGGVNFNDVDYKITLDYGENENPTITN